MKLPKGVIFLYVPEKTTTGITVNIEGKELITCEDCKYCVEIEKTSYCIQREYCETKLSNFCSWAEKKRIEELRQILGGKQNDNKRSL